MRITFPFRLFVAITLMLPLSAFAADPPPTMPQQAQEKQIQLARERLKEAQAVRAMAADALFDVRQMVRSQTGLLEVTPESIRQVIGKMQEQREQLEIDGAGAQGRRKGIDMAVAELSRTVKDRAASDAVADELEKVVQVRQQQLARIESLKASQAVSSEDVGAAVASLAKARAELATAKQRTANLSSDALDSWNRQRLELSINELERQSRLEFIKNRLDAFSKALNQLDRLEELRAQLDQADRSVVKAQDELDASRQKPELKLLYEWIGKKAEEAPHKP